MSLSDKENPDEFDFEWLEKLKAEDDPKYKFQEAFREAARKGETWRMRQAFNLLCGVRRDPGYIRGAVNSAYWAQCESHDISASALDFLFEHGADIHDSDDAVLRNAIFRYHGRDELVDFLIGRGAEVHSGLAYIEKGRDWVVKNIGEERCAAIQKKLEDVAERQASVARGAYRRKFGRDGVTDEALRDVVDDTGATGLMLGIRAGLFIEEIYANWKNGEGMPRFEDLTRKDAAGRSAIDLLAARGLLDKAFDPSLWKGRALELYRLHETTRFGYYTDRYARKETLQTVCAELFGGDDVTLADLRRTFDDKNTTGIIMLAEAGMFRRVVDVALNDKSARLNADDLLVKGYDARTAIDRICHAGDTELAFTPALWRGNSGEMKKIWAALCDKSKFEFTAEYKFTSTFDFEGALNKAHALSVADNVRKRLPQRRRLSK